MPRITQEEADNSISQIRTEEQQELVLSNQPTEGLTVYTLVGLHDELDSDSNPVVVAKAPLTKDNAFAYKKTGEKTEFYVKITSDGHIYNPSSGLNEFRHNKVRLGLTESKWRRVNKKVFDAYLTFLKSKNESWLRHAEREIR